MKKCLILAIITTLVSLFVIPSSAHAFGRRGGRCISGGCSFSSCSFIPCHIPLRTVVEVPVAVPILAYPVLVPAYQFQYVPQAYAPTIPVVPVTGYPIATPIIQPVAYGQPPVAYGQPGQPAMPAYGQYGQPQQQNLGLNNKDKIRELARALLEEMNRMAENGPIDNGPPTIPGTPPFQPTLSQQPPPQQFDNNLSQFALNALQRTCAQCHTGVGSQKSMIIFSQPGYVNQQVNWRKVKEEVASGRMPPRDVYIQLSPQEKNAIIQWLTSIGVN